jgi:hypothetical protein
VKELERFAGSNIMTDILNFIVILAVKIFLKINPNRGKSFFKMAGGRESNRAGLGSKGPPSPAIINKRI